MNRAPLFNLPSAVLWLGAVMILVHAARLTLAEAGDLWVLFAFAFIPARYGEFADLLPGGAAAQVWTPVTYAFLHADVVHLLVNLVWMASFGGALARRFGTLRFMVVALLSAVGGAGLHYVLHAGDEALVVGASGAVSGMMAATCRFAFSPGGPLAGGHSPEAYLLPAEPLRVVLTRSRALGFVLIWFGVNMLFGLVGGLAPGASGPIAWEAHIGGFLAGLFAFPLLDPVAPVAEQDDGLAP